MSRTIWFVVEHGDRGADAGVGELAAAARAVGDRVVAILCAADGNDVAGEVAGHADATVVLQAETLARYSVDGYAQAIVALAREREPSAILLGHTPLGRDLGPALASRLGSGMISDCLDLAWDDGLVGTRSVYRRKLVARERVRTTPAVATCQRGAFNAVAPGQAGETETIAAAIDEAALRSSVVSMERAEGGDEDITEADVVVAGGRGLGDAEKFALVSELASALGGVMAASRPVVDQGWVPHDRQVGSSGVTVRPKLYIALGISGAIQHIVGMREADVIVAVNKDPQAPIFEYSHYGVVGDLFAVVPAMIEALRG